MATLPTHLHSPIEDFLSGFSPEAMGGGDAVHVAVGKSMEKTMALLQWTFRMFPGHEFVLLHVHRPSPCIPTPLGKLPARRANPEMLAAFRQEEREETMKLLSTYLMTCRRSMVKASIITTETDEVQKGIVDLVNLHTIRKLVVEANPDFMRRASCEASHVAKHAPSYCEMWFVNKRKLIWARPASASSSIVSPSCHSVTPFAQNLIPWSFNSGQTEFLKSTCEPLYRHSVSSSANGEYSTPRVSSVSNLKTFEECLCIQLEELEKEVDELKDEAFIKLHEPKIMEDEAMEAFNKVRALETAHSQKEKLRIDAEDSLRITIRGQEELLEEREKIDQQLQKTMRNIALLDTRAQEANCRCEEVAEELKLIEASIATLRNEKQTLQGKKNEATRWLDRWINHETCEDAEEGGIIGWKEDSCEVPELLMSDVERATGNFCESLRIGEGEYGTVYKGEMFGKTVAIKKLHAFDMQRQEFDRALVTGKTKGRIVGKVRRAFLTGKIATMFDLSAGEWSTYVAWRLVELGLHCCESKSRERPELTASLVRELERMPFLEEQTVPSFFLCPILRELMHDPQVAADGFTYEGEAIRAWLGSGRETSPMTNLKLSHLDLTPNYSLKLVIQDWVANLNLDVVVSA